jgi:hypothetical protein
VLKLDLVLGHCSRSVGRLTEHSPFAAGSEDEPLARMFRPVA